MCIWWRPVRPRHPSAKGDASWYAAVMRSRCGHPKTARAARSSSAWPPWAAGSMSTAPSGVHMTFPLHRSPWVRAAPICPDAAASATRRGWSWSSAPDSRRSHKRSTRVRSAAVKAGAPR